MKPDVHRSIIYMEANVHKENVVYLYNGILLSCREDLWRSDLELDRSQLGTRHCHRDENEKKKERLIQGGWQ